MPSSSQGFVPRGSRATSRASAAASTSVASRPNRRSSSATHWSRRPGGVSTSARRARPRAASSASIRPAWTVLPRPTSSASSTRVASPPTTASAGSSWYASRSMRAPAAACRPSRGCVAQAARARTRRPRAPARRGAGRGAPAAAAGRTDGAARTRGARERGTGQPGAALRSFVTLDARDAPDAAAHPHELARHEIRVHFLHRLRRRTWRFSRVGGAEGPPFGVSRPGEAEKGQGGCQGQEALGSPPIREKRGGTDPTRAPPRETRASRAASRTTARAGRTTGERRAPARSGRRGGRRRAPRLPARAARARCRSGRWTPARRRTAPRRRAARPMTA